MSEKKTFMICCSTVKTYWLTVEAENEEQVEEFYLEEGEKLEFHSSDDMGWNLDEIAEYETDHPDFKLDSAGKIIAEYRED